MNRDQIEAMARAPWAFSSADLSEALRASVGQAMRQPLPTRRRNLTTAAAWVAPDGTAHEFAVCVGVDGAGRPREVFCSHAKGAMAATLADACILISIAMQHGITAVALAHSLQRVPTWPGNGATAPASPIGTILDAIAGVEVQPMDGGGV